MREKRQYDLEQEKEKSLFLGRTRKDPWDSNHSFNVKLLIRPKAGYLPTGSCWRGMLASLIF